MDRIEPARLSPSTRSRPLALVADDSAISRVLLRVLLDETGYDVIEAGDGAEAVERFRAARPDIVFMDVVMPVLDGLSATMQIKVLSGEAFVPVIFVTAVTEDDILARCMECGGDDFLVKPYSGAMLAAKIRALDRIRVLQQRASGMRAEMEKEAGLARAIHDGAVTGLNVTPPGLRAHLQPAATFNGDVLLTAYSPDGDLNILIGDFTGHGLSATVGALPAAETFRAMVAKGFHPAQILSEINKKLHALLPTGVFLAAAFVRVNAALERVTVINCGMPDLWLLDGPLINVCFGSRGLPLAVTSSEDYGALEASMAILPGCRMVMFSDGVPEAGDAAGQFFGMERLREAVAAGAEAGDVIGHVMAAIDAFRSGMPLMDDVSIVDVHLVAELFRPGSREPLPARPVPAPPSSPAPEEPVEEIEGWRLSIELRSRALQGNTPVPLLMSLLKDFPSVASHRGALFTVVSELYNNALDHGVLELDSTLKRRDFDTYLEERDAKLRGAQQGRLALTIDCSIAPGARQVAVSVEDSGKGFDPASVAAAASDRPHGRGIALVRGMCRSLEYNSAGNHVRALYDVPPDAPREAPV